MKKYAGKLCIILKNKRPFVYSAAVLAATTLFWGYMLLTRCENIDSYFVKDHGNTSMDYFNMLSNIYHGDPYYANANYPALCFVFFKIMYHLLPSPVSEEYGDGYYLRENMIAQLGYMLFVMISMLIIWNVMQRFVKGTYFQKLLFGAALLFSGPMVFALERGNILLLTLAFLMVFLLCYDSEKMPYRIIAYLALSIAAGLKIYPAVFGLLVVWKKRYKESVLLVVMGIIVFILPFFCFNGLESLRLMLEGISISSTNMTGLGLGLNYSFPNLFLLVSVTLGGNATTIPAWVNLVPILLCAFFFFISDSEWKKLYVLALFCIWLPRFAYTYVLLLMFLPILSFYFKNREDSKFDFLYSFSFWIMMIPMCTPMIDRINDVAGDKFPVSLGTGLVYLSLTAVLVGILIEWLQKAIIPQMWNMKK